MARLKARTQKITELFERFESVFEELDEEMIDFSNVSDEVGMSGEAIVDEMRTARGGFNECWSIIEDIIFDARQATGLPERKY